jgi:hypothetical protein
MMQHKRRRMLIKAVHDAARELAARRYTTAPLDDDEPMPDEPVIMAFATGPYLDDKRPTPDEIRAFKEHEEDDPDELWAAFAINPVNGTRYAGLGRTAAEAKACAWINSHWAGRHCSCAGENFNESSRRLDFRAISTAEGEPKNAGNQLASHLRARPAHNPQRDARSGSGRYQAEPPP